MGMLSQRQEIHLTPEGAAAELAAARRLMRGTICRHCGQYHVSDDTELWCGMSGRDPAELLIATVLDDYSLDLGGIHGPSHWLRVMQNGLSLASLTGADKQVVALFALLHDSQRQNDGSDRQHGKRAADYCRIRHYLIDLDSDRREQLAFACANHTGGTKHTSRDITVRTCWDADRLDLGRTGAVPDQRRLLTDESEQIIEWAYERSLLPAEGWARSVFKMRALLHDVGIGPNKKAGASNDQP